MTLVDGFCDPRFAGVRSALETNLSTGRDLGASVAVALDGVLVVDLWGGLADAAGTPWECDTVVNVFSSTKTMTALCALVLFDRGELSPNAPVANYWPEFAAAGKEGVLVRHLLGHTSGLPVWTEPMAVEDLYDWDKACGLLARQAPLWEPGTAAGYHGITQGYLVGEVVRRVASCSLGTFFRDEIAGPLQADFHIGTPPSVDRRIATLVAPTVPLSAPPADDDGLYASLISNPPVTAEMASQEVWRRAEIPAGNGHGNARSMAQVQHVLACGGTVGDVTLLSEAGCSRVLEEQASGLDRVLGVPLRWGMGYALNSPEVPISPNPRACYWGGWGGSLVINDLDARLTFAYAMNRMADDPLGDERAMLLALATFESLSREGSGLRP